MRTGFDAALMFYFYQVLAHEAGRDVTYDTLPDSA